MCICSTLQHRHLSKAVPPMVLFHIAGYATAALFSLRSPAIFRVVICWAYFLMCAYIMAFMSTLTSYRMPDSQPLPDLLHDLIPMDDGMLKLLHLPDVFIGFSLVCTAVLIISHKYCCKILCRIFIVYSNLMILRSVTIIVTSLPDPSPKCAGFDRRMSWPQTSEEWSEIYWKAVRLLMPLGEVTCGDMVFSGHSITLLMCAMVWHTYYNPPCYRMLYYFFLYSGSLMSLFSIIATRLHYTLDVLLAAIITVRSWGTYHRVATDVQEGKRYITFVHLDTVMYWLVEWIETHPDETPQDLTNMQRRLQQHQPSKADLQENIRYAFNLIEGNMDALDKAVNRTKLTQQLNTMIQTIEGTLQIDETITSIKKKAKRLRRRRKSSGASDKSDSHGK